MPLSFAWQLFALVFPPFSRTAEPGDVNIERKNLKTRIKYQLVEIQNNLLSPQYYFGVSLLLHHPGRIHPLDKGGKGNRVHGL
jgi:hypothetical protein